jgi:hypothetical protein
MGSQLQKKFGLYLPMVAKICSLLELKLNLRITLKTNKSKVLNKELHDHILPYFFDLDKVNKLDKVKRVCLN